MKRFIIDQETGSYASHGQWVVATEITGVPVYEVESNVSGFDTGLFSTPYQAENYMMLQDLYLLAYDLTIGEVSHEEFCEFVNEMRKHGVLLYRKWRESQSY